MQAESQSSSELVMDLLFGPTARGTVLGRHELRFGDYVLALTPPRSPRMPNGIECSLGATERARVSIGRGKLVVGRVEVTPGRAWNPIPVFEPLRCLRPGPEPLAGSLGRWMDSTDPSSSALLAGYVAGLVLLQDLRAKAAQVASHAMTRLGPAGATLLRHATRGEVPEPVHDLLRARNPERLISSSPLGIAWLRGLISAGLPLDLMTVGSYHSRRTA